MRTGTFTLHNFHKTWIGLRVRVMLNNFTKMLLVGTSLVPTLLIMAVDHFFMHGVANWWGFGTQLVVIAVALVVIALAVMHVVKRSGERQQLQICKAKNSDKQVLTFLLAYLMPILSEHKYLFRDFNVPTLTLLLLLALAVYHSNAFDFNPMLGMLGYHFYEIEDGNRFPYLLMTRTPLKKSCQELIVVQLCDYTFLVVEK
jgi:hypothetical protein